MHITKTHLFKCMKLSPPKTETFQIKNSDIFHISALNINKKNNVHPFKPQFYYIIVGFKGVKIKLMIFLGHSS